MASPGMRYDVRPDYRRLVELVLGERRRLARRAQIEPAGGTMAQNLARFEEGTEITIDAEVEAGAVGWTLGHTNVARVGGLVAVHIEATFAAAAASLVTTLQAEFAPADTVTDATGNWTIGADGTVHYGGSTAGGGTARLNVNYIAGHASP